MMQAVNSGSNALTSPYDSKTSSRASGLYDTTSQDTFSFQMQMAEMNHGAFKLGSLIMKLENLIETHPALKTGD